MDASPDRFDLFPEIKPFETGRLLVDGVHELYWEQSGRADGVPVVFLHGGPGAGASPVHRRFFDPDHYRVIILDQRGAGYSKPRAEIVDNTTDHLIDDIEALRRHLGVDSWLVFGGSWGAALGLAYGIRHAERCLGFVLRGIFLCRRHEIEWFLDGLRAVYPEAWRDFAGHIDEAEQDDLLEAYYRRLTDPDPAVHMPAAQTWSRYESSCSRLLHTPPQAPAGGGHPTTLGLARIEAHYFRNRMFMAENHLLDHIAAVTHLPAVIVQGRYDMICPVASADELARAWPGVDYVIVPDAGHSAMEPGIRSALVSATERLKTIG
jgi:proline iminopeptidase